MFFGISLLLNMKLLYSLYYIQREQLHLLCGFLYWYNMYVTIYPVGWYNLPRIGVNYNILGQLI